jgi:hypothetical protein
VIEGGDLRRAVVRIIALAKSRPKDPFGALRDFVESPPRGPSLGKGTAVTGAGIQSETARTTANLATTS